MAPPRIAEQIGRVLGGRYRLVAPLGTGASAHVYVADDVKLRRRVAVKVLHPALAQDETFLRRFRAEAQAAAALRHPHVLQVFDWGEDEDGPWLVLEYLSGGSLRDLLDRQGRITPSQARLIGAQAAQGLDYAHRRGLVHRDIKPANLLFDDEERLVIADFGLARALAEAAWTEPAGAILGTARYASPEQAKGSRVDDKADVYALGLVLIEAVTGSVPFSADTTIATLMARIDRAVEVPEALGPMRPALAAAGAADPAERTDAATLRRMLEDIKGELPPPDPLPLGGAIDEATQLSVGALGRADDDLTIIPPTTGDANGGRPRLYDEFGRVDDGRSAVAERTARRWLKRIAILVVTLALLGAGGVGIAASGIAKPSHSVPNVIAMTLAEARSAVADEKFDVVQSRTEPHETVPAGAIISQTPREAAALKEGEAIRVVVSSGPAPRDIPDLANKTAEEAKALLTDRQLGYAEADAVYDENVEEGRIVSWSPTGEAERGAVVTVVLSKGKEPKEIPSFADRAFAAVEKLLKDLGFVTVREESYSDEVEKGLVISTAPAEGESAQPGDEVKVIVSKGPEMVAVPNVQGLDIDDADRRLRDAGLATAGVDGNPFRPVQRTSPAAGTQVKKGTGITLITR